MNAEGCDCSACRSGQPCDCCTGTQVLTPVVPCNRPGLETIGYRVGTWGAFFETMKARLSTISVDVPDPGGGAARTLLPLAGLTTRAGDDFAIALLDCASVMGDVLTFYQERIANEGYLRTATERRSVLELARAVGYTPRPGVASTVFLAYTIDDKQAAPVTIPVGARSQSVPGPGQAPQSFETVEALEARAAWNQFRPRKLRPQTAGAVAAGALYLKGTSTQLKVNDLLLIDSGNGQPQPYRVNAIAPDAANDRSRVGFSPWQAPLSAPSQVAAAAAAAAPAAAVSADPVADVMQQLARPASVPPRNALALPRDLRSTFTAGADIGTQIVTTFLPQLSQSLPAAQAESQATPGNRVRVYALRQRAGLFASNLAGSPNYVRDESTGMVTIRDYTAPTIDTSFGNLNPAERPLRVVALDGDYDRIGEQGWALIDRAPAQPPPVIEFAAAAAPTVAVAPPTATDRSVTVHRVMAVRTGTLSAFGAASKSTQLALEKPWLHELDGNDLTLARTDADVLRGSVVYAQSEELPLAEAPIEADLCQGGSGSWIELDGYYPDLKAGRWVIVSGTRADVTTTFLETASATAKTVPVPGVQASELVMLANVVQDVSTPDGAPLLGQDGKSRPLPGESLHTFVQFSKDLGYCYARDAVSIYANVVKATHGETQNEVLGNGDGSKALQAFTLKKPPLTFVSAPTADGAASTLHAWVDGVEWHETGSLAWLGARERGFVTFTDDAGVTTLRFGDGERGARLPTGVVNVRAAYRSGIGSAGNVEARQISQLQTRPLGVKEVINPVRASGGADRESRDLARENAPLSVMPLDRLVSVQDYADFTRRFAGIGKAVAQRTSDGRRQLVFLTIAGVDDAPIDRNSDLYRNLLDALLALGDPDLPLRVEPREFRMLVLAARIRVAADHVWDDVAVAVRARLLASFGFGRRALGQGVRLSEVVAVLQGVRGVDYSDIDTLGAISEIAEGTSPRRPRTPEEVLQAVQDLLGIDGGDTLPADVGAWPGGSDGGVLRPAEIVVFSPAIPGTLVLNPIP